MRRADIEVPNHAVDMDSWARSACYPRGTFYPLSDGHSTMYRRITSPDFRPCLRCLSHSQAPLCTYTRHLIANQAEGTFGRLRYFLGATAPQLNYPSGTVPDPDHGPKLDVQSDQSGISTMTPPELASGFQRLPPILHKPLRTPIPNYSKGLGGLSVLLRVTSIFTRTAISPSLWLRQRGSRYSIRAGRNLPDKEFRYLRMVIVTTAVYWGGLNSQLRHKWLTGPLNLPAPGRSQSVYIVLRLRTDLCF